MQRTTSTLHGDEPNPLDATGLCLLSLDGGGVRGLSTLYILKSIMDRLNHERKTASLPPVKPCEVFDLIGGTSTGGLIAIMLGRLEMDVDECIVAYSDLAAFVFSERMSRLPVTINGKIKPRFDSAKLGEAIRKVVAQNGASDTELLNDENERGCRTFVCTADRSTKDIIRLRSYSLPEEPDIRATICQAALATSAATTFFEPVSIGNRTFADGGLGANNPVDETEGEASNIWCSETGDLKPLVKCFISIGTGNPGKKAFDDSLIKFLGQTVVDIATESENTERKFMARWAGHFDSKRYFRFNVDQGLQDVGLDEYKRVGAMEAATSGYITHTTQRFRVRDCVQNLKLKQNRPDTTFAAVMNEYTVRILQRHPACGALRLLRSDSIFLQERLLVREDVQSFLTEALSCSGHVRVILHGLPGIGKSTIARSFAYNAQKTMAILWIPGNSEAAIKQAFEQYTRQICENDQQYSEPMSLIARQLSECFSNQWLVVFDGLDAPLINIQQYLFADLGESKVLITTRNTDLGSYIKATHVLQVNPLNEQIGQDLLSVYMNTDSASLTAGQAVQEEQTLLETDARRRIVKELGGLPLAIAIVGAALRKEGGIPSINSHAYLAWADEVKDILLEQDPVFSDYSSSVWKTFQFAFQGILQGTGINQNAAFMAHFAASCENAANLAEYIRLYRKFTTGNTASTRSAATQGHSVIGQLRFLEIGFFELAIKALAALNMVTVNWIEDGPNDVPYIEMHSLVRRWLVKTNYDKVFTYAGSKMWLLGFGMYDQLNGSRVGASRFEPLLKEVSETLIENPRMLDDSQVPASEAIFPLLLDAQIKLSKSIDFLPAGSAQRSRLHQFSRELESELTNSYDNNLEDIDWNSVFQAWARELGEQVEYAVASDAEKDDYMLKDFFLDTLDAHECIPIAFGSEAPYELHHVGQTNTIEEIKADITARIESLLVEHLAQEAFRQLPAFAPNESSAFIRTWLKRWEKDVSEIIRNCLAEVFAKLQSAADTQRVATELPSPSNSAAVVGDQSSGGYLQSVSSLSDPRNAFFAVLRRTVKAAAEQFLNSCPVVEILNEQKDAFRDICERAVRKGFNDRAADAFLSQQLSAEAGIDTVFSILWELAWPGRFLGDLDNLIAAKTFEAISDDLKDAAKQGFSNTFENYLSDSSSFVQKLAYEVFSASAIRNMFPNWILSGWIDPLSDDEDSDDEEPTYINLMHESKQQIVSAMKRIYDDRANVANEGTVVQALKSMFLCRKAIHNEVMDRLNQPELTDRTGIGPFFAKMHFEDCDKSLRLVCPVLQHGASEDFVESLDHLIRVENAWNFSKT